MFTIILCKILYWIGSKLGRGSSLPGSICLKLNPRILKKLKMPDTVIAVTGSNGKTSTTAMLLKLARASGKKVICNAEGSNQIEGVTTVLLTNTNPFTKKVKADVVILESDERFCQYSFRDMIPTHIVITNLFRDQLTRNGNWEFVRGELAKGLPARSMLILNADDPVSGSLAQGHSKVMYYGVTADYFHEPKNLVHAYDDGAYCPICHGKMDYKYRLTGQVGNFCCRSCGFRSGDAVHNVTRVENGSLVIDGEYSIRPQVMNTSFAQNISAAFTVGTEVLGMAPEDVASVLNGLVLENGRVVEFTLGGRKGHFMLTKHENSMAYNAAIATALSAGGDVTVAVIVDRLSRKYVANDMSWLWDIDFERLADSRVKKIVLSGGFAHDLASRCLLAGIDGSKLTVEPDLDSMMEILRKDKDGELYVFTCFTDQYKFLNRLKRINKEEAEAALQEEKRINLQETVEFAAVKAPEKEESKEEAK